MSRHHVLGSYQQRFQLFHNKTSSTPNNQELLVNHAETWAISINQSTIIINHYLHINGQELWVDCAILNQSINQYHPQSHCPQSLPRQQRPGTLGWLCRNLSREHFDWFSPPRSISPEIQSIKANPLSCGCKKSSFCQTDFKRASFSFFATLILLN